MMRIGEVIFGVEGTVPLVGSVRLGDTRRMSQRFPFQGAWPRKLRVSVRKHEE